jgi:gliding motility-associated-like protein
MILGNLGISFAQRDTTFWFAAPFIDQYKSGLNMRITALNKEAQVTITQPATPSFAAITRTVSPNSTVSIDMKPLQSAVENFGADVVTNKGLLIRSTANILVVWEPNDPVNPDIFALKGRNGLGTDFIVTSQKRFGSFGGVPSSFYVVATENSTVVSITPSVNLVGHPVSSGTYTVNLNRGQVYVADASTTDAQTVGGTIVTSTKPVAITMANDLTSPPGGCGDLNGDQLVPTTLAGDKFITLPGGLNIDTNITDVVYIYPVTNNTIITINGSVVGTKSRGEFYELVNNNQVNFITTSAPALVYQLSGFGCEVGGAVVPGLDCTGSTQIGVTRSTTESFTLLLLCKSGKEGNFKFNGSSSVITAANFADVPNSNGEWKWAKINNPGPISAGSSAIVTSNFPFHMGVINGGTAGGTRYGYFSNFGGFEPDVFLTPNTFGELFTTVQGSAYQWSRAGVDIPGATSIDYSATESGKYQVRVTYDANCPPATSEAIKVALTPANVGNIPALWLRADKGVTTTSGAVSGWLDTSGNDNHHTQTTSSNRPGYNDRIANFNPAVTFNGSQWIQDNDGILEQGVNYGAAQLFIVHNSAAQQNRGLYGQYVYIDGTKTARYMGHGEFNGRQYFGIKSDDPTNEWVELANGPERLNAYVINTFSLNSAKKQQLWFNGGDLFESPYGGTFYKAANPAQPWVTGAAPVASGSFSNPIAYKQNGQIPELIVFEDELPEYKRHRIETYLAIKYGSQVAHNYYNTKYDGTNAATTTVYDVSTYGKNIAGIARDDNGAFYQKQGRSQNSVQYSRILTMGVGEIAASNELNTNTLEDGTYLVWGDDGKAPAEKDNAVTSASAKILGRTWKIQVKGTSPGNITVHFDLTGVTTSATGISDLKLAINRSGSEYFSPDAVDYYEADASSTLTSVVFKDVKWDSDGSGLDVFTLQTKTVDCTISYIPKITQRVIDPCNGPVELSVNGAALNLDGTNDYVEIPNVLVGATNFAFETWIFYRGGGEWARVVDFGNNTNEYFLITLNAGPGALKRGNPMVAFSKTSSSGEQRIFSDVPFPQNQWAHFAFSIEGNTGKIYINGVLVGQKDNLTLTLANLNATVLNFIGKSQYSFDPYLNAKLDEMRFWKVARSQTEIQDGLKQRFPNNYPNLVGYYTFDEGSGTKAFDGSISAGEGKLLNGTSWETPSTSPSGSYKSYTWSTGETTSKISASASGTYSVDVVDSRGCTGSIETGVLIGAIAPEVNINDEALCPVNLSVTGHGLVFDGTDDYVEINNNLSTAKNFAFEAWVLWDGGGQWQRIFDFGSGEGVNMFFTVLSSDGKPRFAINLNPSGNVSTEQRILSSVVMPQYQWTHMAVTIDNGVGRMFMNGVQVGINSAMTSFPSNLGATTQNWLGRSQYPDPYFKGKMDEVRFWNIARSASEINQYKNFRFPADYPGLVAYYQFDEGKGTDTFDKTPTANVGKLKNGTKWENASSPSGTYSAYKWSTDETTSLISVKAAGTYSVEVTDDNGCKVTSSVDLETIQKFAAPTLSLDGPATFCYGIGVNITSSESQDLKWYKDGVLNANLTGQTINVLDSGLYKVLIDRNGCLSEESAEQEINIDLTCDQDGDGVTDGDELEDSTGYLDGCDLDVSRQTLEPSGAWAALDCDEDNLSNSDEVLNGTSLTSSDTDGDGVMDGPEVADATNPLEDCSFDIASQTEEPTSIWKEKDCDGDGVTNQAEKVDGTDLLVSCSLKPASQTVTPSTSWSASDCDGDGVTNSKELSDETDLLEYCSYVIASQTLTPTILWQNEDCDNDGNKNGADPNPDTPTAVDDEIGILEADYAKFNVLTNDDFLAGNQISIQRSGGTAKGTEVINQQTGEITYRSAPGEVGTVTLIYTVCNTAVTPAVCAEATVTLEITIAELSIPEGFSPNSNGKNDKWVITGLEAYPQNSIKVFNRWGNEVFAAAPYKYSWDGSSVSGGKVPAGTYYYVLDLGNGKKLTGYVYVAR